ncbi:MAG: XRE family transcriptional regulator, partial [Shewanella sp.]
NNNIISLRGLTQYLLDKDVSYSALLLKNDGGQIVGHWSGIANLEAIHNSSKFFKVNSDELKKSVLVMPGHYTSSKHYFELICVAICYYLLNYVREKDYAYFFIVDFQPLVSFCKIVFEAEEVKYCRGYDNKMGGYLMKINIIKAVSNPVIIKDVQARLFCLSNCDGKCKQCNLKSL